MAGITGQGTTFNLPNYVGELFASTPTDTPFLSALGGLTGGEMTSSTLFQWQGYDLRAADPLRQKVEGANAPTAEQRVRFNVNNVVEIHQEAVEVSYSKLAATGQYNSTGSAHPGSVGITGANPVLDEMDWQTRQALAQIARDIEAGFIVGSFSNPATNATARRTRGIMAATATNVSDKAVIVGNGASTIEADNETVTEATHGLVIGDPVIARAITGGAVGVLAENQVYYVKTAPDANTFTLAATPGGATITFDTDGTADFYEPVAVTKAFIEDLLRTVWDNGGIAESETATLMTNSLLKPSLTKLFITDANYQETSRTVGGVTVQTIQTEFGILNVMLNRYMPSGALQVVSLEECAPVFLNVPGKGFLFAEPLAKQGAAERSQIYGEVGLKYGNEKKHGKLLGVKPVA